jgi:predicted amino acid dehydrogenase
MEQVSVPHGEAGQRMTLGEGDNQVSVNRFAFVIHPLDVSFIHQHPHFKWSVILPDALVEWIGARVQPLYLSRITGGCSPTTGQRIEGYLYTLGATPRWMVRQDARETYKRLIRVANRAEGRGARIMGLGAFTSVVGDAGITVARQANIAVTTGNSLTVAITVETARRALLRMGDLELASCKVMVIGATGSVGSACARWLASMISALVLVSPDLERLQEIKRRVEMETPGAQVIVATHADDQIASCDLIITATTALGQRVLDITRCKPGAVICDVARPPDIKPDVAALRPDVLVVESGAVLIPGDINFGYDMGLPPKATYACLAETALLAMEGRFEDFTIGREISLEKVREIDGLFRKHAFQLADLCSFGQYIYDEELARRRLLADRLRGKLHAYYR